MLKTSVKALLIVSCILMPTISNAGLISFSAGAVAGAALGAAGGAATSKASSPGTLLSSDTNSVIVCEMYSTRQCDSMSIPSSSVPQDICLRYEQPYDCARTNSRWMMYKRWHLEDLVRISGFTTIVRRSILVQDGKQYHVLEVK